MTQNEINNLIKIRNQDINIQIEEIKKIYDIDITNDLLNELINYSNNAILYYNNKYNCFKGDDYEKLYYFIDKFNCAQIYNYNLLNINNCNQYHKFLKNIHKDNIISNIYTIIQEQIEIKKNKNILILNNNTNINYSIIKQHDNINIDLPIEQYILFLVYYYINDSNTIESIKQSISYNIEMLKNNRCELFENIFFNYVDCLQKTNFKSELYFDLLREHDELYNAKLHYQLLLSIEGFANEI